MDNVIKLNTRRPGLRGRVAEPEEMKADLDCLIRYVSENQECQSMSLRSISAYIRRKTRQRLTHHFSWSSFTPHERDMVHIVASLQWFIVFDLSRTQRDNAYYYLLLRLLRIRLMRPLQPKMHQALTA